jgi:two-component system response regulator GlrR
MTRAGTRPPCGHILLVERKALLRDAAAMWLGTNDYFVRAVATRSEAIVELASNRYELVITDINLDSAEELTLPVWLNLKHPEIPLIGTLSEELTPEARGCARQLGMRLFLVKPYRLPALLDAVKCALTTHGATADFDQIDGR